jgi:hypothetical protein
MAEITTGTPIQLPTPTAAAPTTLQKIENTVFAFLQAHYAKLVSGGLGFLIAKIGFFTFIGRFL